MKLIDDFARFYPVATIIYALLINDLYLVTYLMLSNFVNGIIKYSITKPILGNKVYPIIGSGTRPRGAKNCGIWKDPPGYKPTSYGMPSGHSQEATGFATYMVLKNISEGRSLFDPSNIILSSLALFIIYSRVYLKCHTIQQVTVGGLLGILFSSTAFKYKTPILKALNFK